MMGCVQVWLPLSPLPSAEAVVARADVVLRKVVMKVEEWAARGVDSAAWDMTVAEAEAEAEAKAAAEVEAEATWKWRQRPWFPAIAAGAEAAAALVAADRVAGVPNKMNIDCSIFPSQIDSSLRAS